MKTRPRYRPRPFELPAVPPRAVVEAALIAALFFCPLALGTVPIWAIGVMFALAALAVGWLASTEPNSPFASPPVAVALFGTALYLGLQCAPLPGFLLRLLSHRTAELYAFSLAGFPGAQGAHPLSLDTPSTGKEFVKALAYAASFLAAYQLATSRRVRRRLAIALALSGLAVAGIGYLHRLLGLGQLFGRPIYQAAMPRFVTTFGNSNNTAGLLVLCAPIALGLALRSRNPGKRALWILVYLLTGAAVFLTVSRGGIAAFLVGQGALAVLLRRSRQAEGSGQEEPNPRPSSRAAGGIIAALAVVGIAAYLAYQPVSERFRDFTSIRDISHTGKLVGFGRSLGVIRDFPLTGIGRGAFPTVSARYLPFAQTAEYVENEPIQLAVDLGVPIATVLLIVLGAAFLRVLRERDLGTVECALWAGLFSLGLQNLADFSLELGGVALPATVALAVLLRSSKEESKPARQVFPRTILIALGIALPSSAWALAHASPDWRTETDAFARFAPYADGVHAERAAEPVLLRHPASYVVPLAVADRYLRDAIPAAALDWANRAMYFKRDLSTGHLISATAFAELGRKQQALLEARLYFGTSNGNLAALRSMARFYPELDDLRACVDDTGSGLLALSDFMLGRHHFGEATRAAELAVLAAPDDPKVHDRASGILTAAAQFDEAKLEAQRGIELAPDDSGGYLALEAAEAALGELDAAQDALERGLRARPGQDDLAIALVHLQLAQGHPKLAEASLQQLGPQVGGDQRAQLFALQGDIYAREGRTVKAEEAYRNAARLSSTYTWNLVVLLEGESKLTAAQSLLQEMRATAPESQRGAIDQRITQEQARLEALEQRANARALLGGSGGAEP